MSLKNQISCFQVEKEIEDNVKVISSVDFSKDGQYLITSSEDDTIHVYNCERGNRNKKVTLRKYGAGIVKFTRDSNYVIHSSTKSDDAIRYLNLKANTHYEAYFKGHSNTVTSISVSPQDPTFLSASKDNTVKLWDLREYKRGTFKGYMKLDGRPVVSYDPEGVLFAAGINSEKVHLYDIRYYKKGPFKIFKMPSNMTSNWTSLKFSPNGESIMINTDKSVTYMIDAFTGLPLYEPLNGHFQGDRSLEASFTPDSELILSGSDSGKSIFFWQRSTGKPVWDLKCNHTMPLKCVMFNPKLKMFVSACNRLQLWYPISA